VVYYNIMTTANTQPEAVKVADEVAKRNKKWSKVLASDDVLSFVRQAGRNSNLMAWTDEELDQQIATVKLVREYLVATGDATLVVEALSLRLQSLEGFKFAREHI